MPKPTLVWIFVLFLQLSGVALSQGTCSGSSPCAQGCCSKSGYCGFGPAFCGAGNCTSSCNAQAECGQYAPSGSTLCPLNVCCSQYGFCGTTTDFCGTGCQNGCAKVAVPGCSSSGGSSAARRIGYYESWNLQRPCDTWEPENIDPNMWTHINFAFALIGSNYQLAQMQSGDTGLYTRVTALREQNPALKVFISVGGWSAGGAIFSSMCSSSANRATFINSVMSFMRTYGFNGIDIDWEYPVASDRGGNAADAANFVLLLQELRAATGTSYGITATLPSSYWYMKGFSIVKMEPYVDWFNFMSYDIHGTWDGDNPYTQAVVNPHTNLTEIALGLDLLWRNSISPSKVVLGLGFYGRSFTLSNPSCNKPGCAFSGGGNPGSCTGTSGILSNAEIQRIITQYSLTPIEDATAAVKWIVWNSNQWVSYDDATTYALKQNFANSLCLGGTMAWALDLDDPTTSQSALNLNSDLGNADSTLSQFSSKKVSALRISSNAVGMIFWTACAQNPSCPIGTRQMPDGLGHGKVFDTDKQVLTGNGCHGGGNGFNRALCVQDTVAPVDCGWYGKPGACNTQCPYGYLQITANSHQGGSKNSCKSGRYLKYCCRALKADPATYCPASSGNQIFAGGLSPRAPDLETKAYGCTGGGCSVGGPMFDPPDCFSGSTALGLIAVAIAGIWIGGTFFGYGDPGVTTTSNRKLPTTTTTITTSTYSTNVATRTCDGNIYPQPCLHYSSVISKTNSFSRLTCPLSNSRGGDRPAVTDYNGQHNTKWINNWTQKHTKPGGKADSCQRDEWPPARFHQGASGQWIRLLPAWQNGQVANGANGWNGFCPKKASSETKHEGGPINLAPNGMSYIETTYESRIYTVSVMEYTFTNMPPWPDAGMTSNPCWPATLTNDPGFALLLNDGWYNRFPHAGKTDYSTAPSKAVTSGKRKPSKRWLDGEELPILDPADIVLNDGNSSRRPTREELREEWGIVVCESKDCREEAKELGLAPKATLASIPVTETGGREAVRTVHATPMRGVGRVSPATTTVGGVRRSMETVVTR